MSNALNDFVVAAGSYFGLPEGRVMEGSTINVNHGTMELVLCITLTTEDVVGIGKRMGVLMTEAKVDAAQVAFAEPEGPTREQLRAMYNQLPASQRSAFGSFARYVAACEANMFPQEEPVRKDGPLDLPAHVWMYGGDLTEQQKALAVGTDGGGRYAMDPADLTEEQRQMGVRE